MVPITPLSAGVTHEYASTSHTCQRDHCTTVAGISDALHLVPHCACVIAGSYHFWRRLRPEMSVTQQSIRCQQQDWARAGSRTWHTAVYHSEDAPPAIFGMGPCVYCFTTLYCPLCCALLRTEAEDVPLRKGAGCTYPWRAGLIIFF